MSGVDKAKNKAEELGGEAKEKIGKATGNQRLEDEGHVDQASRQPQAGRREGEGRVQGLIGRPIAIRTTAVVEFTLSTTT